MDAGDDAAKHRPATSRIWCPGNVGVLIVNPVDSDAVAPGGKERHVPGIKVIAVDRGSTGVDVVCQIASDNVAGARMATEYLMDLVEKAPR